jgi:hypothetical protein
LDTFINLFIDAQRVEGETNLTVADSKKSISRLGDMIMSVYKKQFGIESPVKAAAATIGALAAAIGQVVVIRNRQAAKQKSLGDLANDSVGCIRVNPAKNTREFIPANRCGSQNKYGTCGPTSNAFCSSDWPTITCTKAREICTGQNCAGSLYDPEEDKKDGVYYVPTCSSPNELFASLTLVYEYKDVLGTPKTNPISTTLIVMAIAGILFFLVFYIYRLFKQGRILRDRSEALSERLKF